MRPPPSALWYISTDHMASTRDETEFPQVANLHRGNHNGTAPFHPVSSGGALAVASLATLPAGGIYSAANGAAMIEGIEAVWSPRTKAWFLVGFGLMIFIL